MTDSSTTAERTADANSTAYRVLRRMFDEGFATGDDSVVDGLCSPDPVEHQFGLAGASSAEALEDVRAAVPDRLAMLASTMVLDRLVG